MWNRKHIVIRAIGDSKVRSSMIQCRRYWYHPILTVNDTWWQGETGVETQKRLIREYYETVEDFEPK